MTGHCKQFAPQYEKVAANLQGLVKVGAVDCDKNKALAAKFGTRGFPTLKIFPVDKTYNPYQKKSAKLPQEYSGQRTAKGIVESVLRQLPNFVHVVSASNASVFLEDDYPKALLFSDKDTISPLMKALSIQFRNRMRFGQVLPSDNVLKGQFSISQSPSFLAVPGSDPKAAVLHTGKLKKEDLIKFVSDHSLKSKRDDPILESMKLKLVRTLTSDDFRSVVLEDKQDIWTVFFHSGDKVPSDLERLATSYPYFKHASFDCSEYKDKCKEHNVGLLPVLRMYQSDKTEYEDFRGSADCLGECFKVGAMSEFVGEHVPNLVAAVTDANWNSFLAPAAERPRPLLLTRKQEPSPLFKSVALHYKGVLTFGLFANPPTRLIDQLNIKKLPQLVIFFSQNGTAETVQGFPFQGGFTFEELTGVLDQFAAPFSDKQQQQRKASPATPAPTGPIAQLGAEEGRGFEALCGGRGGLCAVLLLDGSQGATERREAQLKVAEAVRARKHPSPYHFSWVDAVCHSAFAATFDVTPDKLPALAVVAASKQRYVLHVGKFEEAELDRTLEDVLRGRKKTGPYSQLAPLETRPCAEVHAEMLAGSDATASSEDDDIMKEMMEEIERKRQQSESDEDSDDEGGKKSKKKKRKSKKKK
mmetsp:Transcript_27938/g.73710  ORF Transcript_27938/g.73710 Transcript_27938/m.73710 type:complete len:642 (+) Transcript_27938:72-1997(+)